MGAFALPAPAATFAVFTALAAAFLAAAFLATFEPAAFPPPFEALDRITFF